MKLVAILSVISAVLAFALISLFVYSYNYIQSLYRIIELNQVEIEKLEFSDELCNLLFLNMSALQQNYTKILQENSRLRDENSLLRNKLKKLTNEFINCDKEKNYYRKHFVNDTVLIKIYRMMKLVASKKYDMFNYNCVDFSNNLTSMLRDAGFDAYTYFVRVKCTNYFNNSICRMFDGNHMIVKLKLYIEPITGNIIMPEDYKIYGIV